MIVLKNTHLACLIMLVRLKRVLKSGNEVLELLYFDTFNPEMTKYLLSTIHQSP